MLCCNINIVLEIAGDELTIYRICEGLFNMKDTFKKYLYLAGSLFLAFALSIMLFFVLYKIDAIKSVIGHIVKTMMPFIIGAALAYIICPLCNKLEVLFDKLFSKMKNEQTKEKISRTLSACAGIIIAVIAIYLILMIVIPQLIDSVVRLVQILPSSADKLIGWLDHSLSSDEQLLQYSQQVIDKAYTMLEDWLSNGLLDSVEKVATGVSSGVINLLGVLLNIFIGFIVAVYLLLSRKKFARQAELIVYSILKKEKADTVMEEARYCDRVFGGFINGKILDAVVVSLICYAGMMIFRWINPGKVMMSETLVAVIVGIFNVIPFFGWYIGLFLSALLILMVNPMQCIFFVIFDFILQQIDGNILGPKIIGDTTGISSIWVLFSIFLFGDIWGFAGMLLGVPMFAIMYHWIKNLVFKGLDKNEQTQMSVDYENDFPKKKKTHQ